MLVLDLCIIIIIIIIIFIIQCFTTVDRALKRDTFDGELEIANEKKLCTLD